MQGLTHAALKLATFLQQSPASSGAALLAPLNKLMKPNTCSQVGAAHLKGQRPEQWCCVHKLAYECGQTRQFAEDRGLSHKSLGAPEATAQHDTSNSSALQHPNSVNKVTASEGICLVDSESGVTNKSQQAPGGPVC